MSNTSRILFLTTRNIVTASGEYRLIKNRSETLYSKWGVISDFIALENKEKEKKEHRTINAGGFIDVRYVNLKSIKDLFSSFNWFSCEAIECIQNGNYKAVILSGSGTVVLAKRIKHLFPELNVLLDYHGADEEGFFLAKNGSMGYRIKEILLSFSNMITQKIYSKYLDGCIVVSKSLASYFRNRYRFNKTIYRIPCAFQTELVDIDVQTARRVYGREKYNIENNDILFVYSGGSSPWQCVKESINLFKTIRSKVKQNCKMIIASYDLDTIAKYTEADPNIILLNLEPNEVFEMLPAGDFAFFIREDLLLNNVAYPNKFLEYVASGMRIISTPFVYDIAEIIEENRIGYLVKNVGESTDSIVSYIEKVFNEPIDWEIRNNILKVEGFENTLEPLVRDIIL